MENGGYEAMLNFLQHVNLDDFDVRRIPATEGLQTQKKLSLPTEQTWWHDCLHRGFVYQSRHGLEDHFSQWHETVATELLYASYVDFASKRRERHPLSREHFGTFLRSLGARLLPPCDTGGGRTPGRRGNQPRPYHPQGPTGHTPEAARLSSRHPRRSAVRVRQGYRADVRLAGRGRHCRCLTPRHPDQVSVPDASLTKKKPLRHKSWSGWPG